MVGQNLAGTPFYLGPDYPAKRIILKNIKYQMNQNLPDFLL
jgi:hypothetical protein